jgi:flagella basal body P-ring formation protein FlgA
MGEKLNGSDIPTSFVSSIGEVVWPPKETNNERLKGIFPNPINDNDSLNSLLSELDNLPFLNHSRITARALISKKVLMNFDRQNPLCHLFETIIPLDGEVFGDYCLVYLGKNTPQRTAPSEITSQQYEKAVAIFNEDQQKGRNHDFSDFEILVIDGKMRQDPQIQQMYYQLYSNFGWNEEEVVALINNPNNLLVAARDLNNGKIVSSGLVEFADINFNGLPTPLKLAEITEAATLKEYRGRGLYQKVSDEILRILAGQTNPPDLVFGESNLDAEAVLKVAARQGRIPAFKTALDFNLPHAWMLLQHVRIFQEDRPPNYPYNNLMVTYLTQEILKKLWIK